MFHPRRASGGGDDDVLTIGLITKFPVDFYDIMVDAAKAWDADEAGAEVVFAQGKSGTDDEGEIAAIESMITQRSTRSRSRRPARTSPTRCRRPSTPASRSS